MASLTSFDAYLNLIADPALRERYSACSADTWLTVDASDASAPAGNWHLPACPVIGVGTPESPELFDVLLPDVSGLADIEPSLRAQPLACSLLVQLLRHNAYVSISDGLLAESLTYSTLQHSVGFRNWIAGAPRREAHEDAHPVLVARTDDRLDITLNRPSAHNAYSTAMKDVLCEALHLAHADHTLQTVTLSGRGPSFCAGGDLSEFGRADDAGLAHASRTTRSAGFLLATTPAHTQVRVHGACIGAGIEIPAFADRVSAAPDAFFQLPEVSMGLVPGAGGTVSITARIGRQRTAWMAISGARVDAATALEWGLIDALSDSV